ncbi:MAG: hypothetical protein WCI12_09545 [Actinomycetes bacterium]
MAKFIQEQRRNEETGQDEECVDAEKPSRQPTDAGVIDDDAENSERPDAIERCDIAQTLSSRRGVWVRRCAWCSLLREGVRDGDLTQTTGV